MPVLLHGVLTQLVQLAESRFWSFGSKWLEAGAASLLHNPVLDAAKLCFIAKAVRQPRCCQRDKAVCFVALILRETERLVRCFDLCFRLADCWALEPMVEHQRSFCCFLQTIQGEVEVVFLLRRTTSANPSKGLKTLELRKAWPREHSPKSPYSAIFLRAKQLYIPNP